jgi:nucleoside-diphosphate-sugar epimerase
MRVFLAGGSGAIGVPLVRQLVAAGHHVTALTRSSANVAKLRALGATAAVADALDGAALRGVVVDAKPTHVIHQLTALPKGGPRSVRDLEATNRLRVEGTRNLIDAALVAGAKRIVVGSFALFRPERIGEVPASMRPAAEAVGSLESQTLDASRSGRIEGVVLRYGLFYGPDVASTIEMVAMSKRRMLPAIRGDRGLLPCVHIDDAAAATVLALDRAPAGSVYDIVDDAPVSLSEIAIAIAAETGAPRPFAIPSWLPRLFMPYMARIISMRLPLSNAEARAALGWRPRYSTMREGLAHMFRQAHAA